MITRFRRHKNASAITKTRLTYEEVASQSGICAVCIKDGLCEIGQKAKTGRTVFPKPFGVAQFGAEKRLPNIEDIQILPELFGENIIFRKVNTEIEIGGFKSTIPVAVAGMGSTKVASSNWQALMSGAAKAGIPIVIGENVLATFGRDGLEERIKLFLEHYKGKGAVIVQGNVIDQKLGIFEIAKEAGAHGIEIKLGQGAKQGLGGEIEFEGDDIAKKYEEMGYAIIKIGERKYQRHTPPGSLSEEGIRDLLIKYSELEMPIWIKTGFGQGIFRLVETLQKIKEEQGIPLQCLTVDGFGGGTGMSPWLIMNEMNIPSAALFSREIKVDFDILLAGGYNDGLDVAKAMMLGAKGVAMGRAFLIAAQVDKENGIVNFVEALKEELQMVSATQKVWDVKDIIGKRENLFALSKEAAELFNIKNELR